uniref:Phosphatidylcholine transfer protein n=1 Tax=Oryzias sinensis TaxID=183150 RepID=A0A8C8DU91_9TELE
MGKAPRTQRSCRSLPVTNSRGQQRSGGSTKDLEEGSDGANVPAQHFCFKKLNERHQVVVNNLPTDLSGTASGTSNKPLKGLWIHSVLMKVSWVGFLPSLSWSQIFSSAGVWCQGVRQTLRDRRPVLQLSGVFAVSSSSVSHEVHQETGLYEYKVFGVLATCSAELCADVYMDLTYRKHWDQYAKELYEKDFDGETAIYWEVKYPFPLSNRDYVYVRERRDLDVNGRKIWVILARSSPETACPEKSGVLRVNDYKQSVALESDGANGTRVFMNYFNNTGGMIPKWVINWAAKSGVPGFLTDMQKACSNYKNYLQSTGA